MPELAEVEYYRKRWNPGLDESVRKVHLHPKARVFRDLDPAKLKKVLIGTTFKGSQSHGKQLCFMFSDSVFLGIHLGMAGRLLTAQTAIVPDRHEHLVLVMESVALVFSDYRMFGKVLLHEGQTGPGKGEKSLPEWWSQLPPQPQEAAFDQTRYRSILVRHPRRPLKALLLDQSGFPGIGNWMADEILWRARIHPASTANHLSPYKKRRLFEEIKQVCEDALRVIGSDWGDPPDQWLFNHRWKRGGTCPASGKPLVHETIGGRTTCFCPAIQKK
ncbi:Fpg/Nei family DNA glycosylase [Puniceicoccales bacterium CK1056]|uniref:Fpg/Nei family DNA glycosylase n=1 Tax=Oceanipulchritudo coccoides TaxID=2706888 RepID=A0A6B2M1Z2_9BACT|nr:DNA-formamidopyrimidine glycosylase family protein [Oceanipulchritudo coccoides]NDV62396.1 Fpg/Nei family DNA glycosylase [Oceanipulchritudo coccoides]